MLLTSAAAAGRAVLVHWWHPETAPPRLRPISSYVVEVFCDCPVEAAVARFEERRRHPGHHDPQRSPAEVEEQVRRVRETYAGPLELGGRLVRVDTSGPLAGNDMVARVREALDLGAG